MNSDRLNKLIHNKINKHWKQLYLIVGYLHTWSHFKSQSRSGCNVKANLSPIQLTWKIKHCQLSICCRVYMSLHAVSIGWVCVMFQCYRIDPPSRKQWGSRWLMEYDAPWSVMVNCFGCDLARWVYSGTEQLVRELKYEIAVPKLLSGVWR